MTGLFRLTRTTAFRLSMIYFGLFATIAAGATGYIYYRTDVLVTDRLGTLIASERQALQTKYRANGLNGLQQEIADRSAAPGNGLYLLADAEGRYQSGNLKTVSKTLWDSQGQATFFYRRNTDDGSEERFAIADILHLANGGRLIIGRDIEDQRRFGEAIRSTFLWTLAGILFVGLSGGLVISHRLMRRVEDITDTSQSIMAGDLSRRIQITDRDDEFDRLAQSLNAMLTRIEELIAGFKEVSDNIAHDLRTPLNRLRNRVEAALRDKAEPQCYREALQSTIEDADELIRTFDALLSIARLEAGAAQRAHDRFDLAAVITDLAELYDPVAEERGIELKVDARHETMMEGKRELIAQAVANILDNAIKYGAAPDGAPKADGSAAISIHLHAGARDAEIVVADRGPGIASDNRERALKRFVRLEASRSQPGTGLGLSLAAAVARLHGGALTLSDNNPGLKATLSVQLSAGLPEKST